MWKRTHSKVANYNNSIKKSISKRPQKNQIVFMITKTISLYKNFKKEIINDLNSKILKCKNELTEIGELINMNNNDNNTNLIYINNDNKVNEFYDKKLQFLNSVSTTFYNDKKKELYNLEKELNVKKVFLTYISFIFFDKTNYKISCCESYKVNYNLRGFLNNEKNDKIYCVNRAILNNINENDKTVLHRDGKNHYLKLSKRFIYINDLIKLIDDKMKYYNPEVIYSNEPICLKQIFLDNKFKNVQKINNINDVSSFNINSDFEIFCKNNILINDIVKKYEFKNVTKVLFMKFWNNNWNNIKQTNTFIELFIYFLNFIYFTSFDFSNNQNDLEIIHEKDESEEQFYNDNNYVDELITTCENDNEFNCEN